MQASLLEIQFFHDDDCPYDYLEDIEFIETPCRGCGFLAVMFGE